MKKLTAERAAELKAQGITHIASIVKSVYYTKYFKWEPIDNILDNGGKMPRYGGQYGQEYGFNGREINWAHTIRWSQI
jgi:hypothetical protein